MQAIKAGILEAADLLVVNKADLPGADKTVRALQASLEMASGERRAHQPASAIGQSETRCGGLLSCRPWRCSATGSMKCSTPFCVTAPPRDQRGVGRAETRSACAPRSLALLGDGLLAEFLRSREDSDLDPEMERVFARQVSPRQAVQRLLSPASQ